MKTLTISCLAVLCVSLVFYSENSYSIIKGSTESIVPSDFGIPDECKSEFNKTLLERIQSIDIGGDINSESVDSQQPSLQMTLLDFQRSLQEDIDSTFSNVEFSMFSASFIHRIQREQDLYFETIGAVVRLHFLFKSMGFYRYFEFPIFVNSRVNSKTCQRTFVIENKEFFENLSWENPTQIFEPWVTDLDAIQYFNEQVYGNQVQ